VKTPLRKCNGFDSFRSYFLLTEYLLNMLCRICFLESFWAPLPGHLLIEVFFAVCIYLLQVFRYYLLLKRRFHNVRFDIHYKQRNWGTVRVATTTVKWRRWSILEPIIEFQGRQIEKHGKREGTFSGEFIMNPINLKFGTGIHYHDNYEGYNLPQIFIKSQNILYEQTVYLSPIDKSKAANKEQDDWDYEEKFQAYVGQEPEGRLNMDFA